MTDYFTWHAQQLQTLTADNWKTNHRFLVSRCLEMDRACGGISDRLKSLPTLLLLAAQSRRLLLFEWSRPAPLQAFLVPRTNDSIGINWTLPSFVPAMGMGTRLYTKLPTLIKATAAVNNTSTVPVLCARIQEQHGGSDYYNQHPWNNNNHNNTVVSEPTRAFRKVFRSLFFSVFAPSPRVHKQYQREAQQLRLAIMSNNNTDNTFNYKAAHLRAYYGNNPVPQTKVEAVAINAINCASQLVLGQHTPPTEEKDEHILFISDSALALQSIERHAKNWNLPVLTTLPYRQNHTNRQLVPVEPLHLDKAMSHEADDYVDIFVDLLHFANAQCISHGQGGFGRLGVLLSRDPMCFKKYIDQGLFVECSWKSDSKKNNKT